MDGYAELRAFRAAHPYRSLTVDGVEWKYASGQASQEAAETGPALLVLGGGSPPRIPRCGQWPKS